MDPFTIFVTVVSIVSGVASYQQAKKIQKKLDRESKGVEANIESNIKAIPVVYGERRVGGVRVFIDTSKDINNKYLYMVMAMAEGEVEDIHSIEIDGVSIDDDKFIESGLGANFIYEKFLGGDDQTASDLIIDGVAYSTAAEVPPEVAIYLANQPNNEPWNENHKLQGVAYLAMKMLWDPNAYSGVPDITAIVKGKKVYDPRYPSAAKAWSSNPALCIRDYLTNTRYGKGIPESAINDTMFSQAANDYDAFTVTPYEGADDITLFEVNTVVDTEVEIIKNLNDMLMACRGFLPYVDGKYGIRVDQATNHVMEVGSDQIIDGISIVGTKKEDRFNQVKVNFFNKDKQYKEDTAVYPDVDDPTDVNNLYQQLLAEDGGEPLVDDIKIDGINNYYTAREMAKLFLLRSRLGTAIGFRATSELMELEVGDTFLITQSTPEWTNKKFQVQEISLNFDGTVNIQAIEYSESIYTYNEASEETPFVSTKLPDPNKIAPVTDLSASAGTEISADGKTISFIDLSWAAPNDALVDRYEVKYTIDDESVIYSAVAIDPTHRIVDAEGSYDISVYAVNGFGSKSTGVTLSNVESVTDTTAPSDITSINISAGLQAITLDWTNPSEDDFDLVRIKHNTKDTEPDSHSFEVRSDSFVHDIGAYSTTKHYWLAPVDRTGNEGNYVSGGSATTGSIAIGDIPSVAGLFRIALDNDDAPTDTEFKNAIGRDPINNDSVIVNNEFAFSYNGTTWTAVTELIDGSLLVSDSVTANEINTNTVLTESLLANTANITGDLTVTSGKITVQDTDTVINLDPDAQYPFRISQGTEDVVRLGSSTADPFIKGAFIRGMPVGSINEADLSTFVRNVVGVTSEEKTETETLTRLETGGNLTYLETDTITTGLTTVLTLESVAGTQSWLYEYADAGDWENGDFALFNYTLQGYNGSDWENVPLWVNRPIFASGYRISGALIGWSISESYSVTIENNTFTHFRMVVGNMPEEFGGGLHATSTGINCDFKLTSVTGSQVNSDNYVNSFSINDTSGVITVGRTGSLGNLTADISTYVGNQVSSLVDSAPATLDTLNELAAALGDDANFAQTTATALGTKWTQDNTKISNWDDAYEQQHSWEWRWQRWAGLRSPSADTTDAWQTYYETYFTKRTEAVDTTYPLQDSGYINTIDNVDSTGGFGGSTYGNMFGNLSTYHCLIYTNIYVDKEFTVNVTNFSGDDPHAIFVDGKFVHGRIPCCSDTAYNYTFTQGWHRIDLIYSEGGGGDWIRMGWNPKDYTAHISDMTPHRGSENPVYLSDKINAVNNSSNWDTAYGWGDHSTQGYLTSFDITTQTDSKYLRSDADDTTSGNVTFSGSNWYLMSLGARGASSGAYGIGNRSNDAYRQLTFHVPNVAAYSSTGTVPSFGWYSNGSVELMNLKSDSGDLTIKGDFTTGSGGDISTGAYANITSYGNVKATNGVFQVGNTTVIDNARNLTNISDTQSHTKVHKYLGSTGDYIQYVVPLIQLNHAVASTESVFIGKLVAWRGNGLYAPPVIYINCQRKYNTTNYELTYRTEGHTTGFTPVTFVYNGNTYLGVRQSVSSAQTYGGFFVDGYTKGTVPTLEKIAYYDNRGTVLNAEINNSISTSVTSTGSYKFGSSVSVEGTLSAQGYNDANWNAAYTYSQVGHLPLAGGSLSGNLTVGSNNSASSLVVNDIDGAKYQIRTGGYDLKFEKHDADADAYATALELRGVNANDGAPTVYVNNRLDVNGNIKFDGTATTTNQSRGIEWTGFDKEGTTDFSDNAYIKHVTNVGGLSGSVLEIKSMNDASDGVAFTTNSNTGVRINGNTVFNDAYHPNADKWTTARTITLGGDLTGSVSIDGSSDVTLSGQVVNDSHTHDGRYYTESESDGRYLNRSSAIESNLDTKYDADLFGFSTSTTGRPENYGQGISIVSNGNTHNNSNNWITQLAFGTSANSAYFRTKVNASGWNAWRTIWHSGNFATGSDTRNFGSLQINGTTVIDSSRNIRSVPTASIGTALSGNFPDLTSTLDVSSVTAQANFSSNALPYGTDRAQLVVESRHSATKDSLLGFSAPLIDLRANNSSSQWSVAQIIGTVDPESGSNHQGGLVFSTSGGGTSNPAGRRNQGASPTARMLIGATGNVSILTGDLKIGTTTVIDSSRNLTNIGAVTASGLIKGSQLASSYWITKTLTGSGIGSSYDERVVLLCPKVETNTAHRNIVDGKITALKTGGNVCDTFDVFCHSVWNDTRATFTSRGQRSGHKLVVFNYDGIKWIGIKFNFTANPYNYFLFQGQAYTNVSGNNGHQLKVISYYDSNTGVLNSEIYNSLVNYNGNGIEHKTTASTHYFTDVIGTTNYAIMNSGGIDIQSGGLEIGGTSVIDSSRNLTNIGSATVSGAINVNRASNGNSIVTKTGSIINFQVENYTTQTTIRSDTNTLYFWQPNSSYQMKLVNNGAVSIAYDGSFKLDTDASGVTVTGRTNSTTGYQVNGTTVIDSSRNLTNIANITATGLLSVNKIYTAISLPNGGAICRGGTTTATSDLGLYSYVSGNWIRIVTNNAPINFFSDGGTNGRGTIINVSFDTSGNITARGNVTAYSDARLKDNVKTLDGSKVYEMRGVSFTKDGELGSGVIAQELEQVAPELVMTNDDEMQTKSVAYGNVVGYLIEAIKELKQEIEVLKNGTNSN